MFRDIFPDWFPYAILASGTPINGKGVVIFKYPSDPTFALDKMKKTKRLQESICSDRIRLQPPSEKLKETKCLELMDNVEGRNMMRDSIPELLALHVLKHPIGSEPKPKDRNMMRDSIPELLALPKLKHPIGSEPKPKEPLNESPASPLSQQIETRVYSLTCTTRMCSNLIEKEQLNEAPDAHTQVFSPNVTPQYNLVEENHTNLNTQPTCSIKCSNLADETFGGEYFYGDWGKPSTILFKSNEIP
ncbi:hypothetical protein Bca52824_041662 [Brassica carinata]|uniref:Uncharacterized protein n=1 Tax=Brassica carinata TaxID=52824 RepID=A0A8X7RWZ5_BRACI|nr:hypothetical protein Bca52824_041662 [Brassica carinata]